MSDQDLMSVLPPTVLRNGFQFWNARAKEATADPRASLLLTEPDGAAAGAEPGDVEGTPPVLAAAPVTTADPEAHVARQGWWLRALPPTIGVMLGAAVGSLAYMVIGTTSSDSWLFGLAVAAMSWAGWEGWHFMRPLRHGGARPSIDVEAGVGTNISG